MVRVTTMSAACLPIMVAVIAAPPTSAQPYFTGLGDLPGGRFESAANDISADGQYSISHAFRQNSRDNSPARAIATQSSFIGGCQ